MVKKIFSLLLFATVVFAYDPIPAPVPDPNEAFFIYESNVAPPVIGHAIIEAGTTFHNTRKIYEQDAEKVVVEIFTPSGVLYYDANSPEMSWQYDQNDPDVIDPNNPDDRIKGIIWTLKWSWTTTEADIGLHKITIRASDPFEYVERTFIALVKKNRKPKYKK
jgi:hypothetical protein